MRKFYNFLSFTWLVALAILLSTGGVQAQTYTVEPTGGTAGNTNGTGSDPVDDYFKYMRYQVVYTAAELSASGLVGGSTITAVGWNVTQLPGTLSNYTIKWATPLPLIQLRMMRLRQLLLRLHSPLHRCQVGI